MDWAANVDAAALGALVSAASAVLVPRIIERVPEPEPDEEPDGGETPAEHGERADDPTDPTEPVAPAVDPAETMPVRAGEQAPVTQPTVQPAAARVAGPGKEPAEEPKELYLAIADTPGLLWRCILAGAIAGGLIGLAVGWEWSLLYLLPLVPVSLALTVIDWRTRLLPTWLIARTYVGLVVLVLVCTLITQDWQDLVRAAIGWAGAGLLFFVLWYIHPRGLGYGDVRLSGIIGIALGYVGTPELVVGVYAGFLLGGVGGGLLSMLRIVHRKGFPFGPFMFVGAIVGLLAGSWLSGLASG
jgi:leader peptidase (prepilin peptidase)/N-methyltransferase